MKKEKKKKSKQSVILKSAFASGIVTLAMAVSVGPVISNFNAGRQIRERTGVNESLHIEQTASSYDTLATTSRDKINYDLPGMPSLRVSYHKALSVKYNGSTQNYQGLMMNGIAYLPIKEAVLTVAPSARVTYNSSSKSTTVKASGLNISVNHGAYVMYANNRALFSFSPAVVMNDGKMYVTASSLLKALGLSFSNTGSALNINGSFKPLLEASKYYREDEVYWLSKIISAESAGESLLGQIAVGNVIMNRVKSPLFPSTIYSVIFDRKYGVQFSPTLDGRIYANATYTATLAAKICLEGISFSKDSLYFLNPKTAQSNWIVKNREYAYTIGNHDFYN